MILYAGGFSIGIVTGLLLGWWLTLKLYPHPLSREQMRKRGLTECLMCGGMGCYNDLTATHGVGVMVPTGDLPPPTVVDPRLRDDAETT